MVDKFIYRMSVTDVVKVIILFLSPSLLLAYHSYLTSSLSGYIIIIPILTSMLIIIYQQRKLKFIEVYSDRIIVPGQEMLKFKHVKEVVEYRGGRIDGYAICTYLKLGVNDGVKINSGQISSTDYERLHELLFSLLPDVAIKRLGV